MKNILIVGVIALLVGGGIGFEVGTKTQASSVATNAGGTYSGARTKGQAGMMRGGGTIGQVLSKDATSITVKLPTGGSKIVFYDANTQVMQTSSSTIDAVSVGGQVVVSGTPNTDGSVSAKTIQIR